MSMSLFFAVARYPSILWMNKELIIPTSAHSPIVGSPLAGLKASLLLSEKAKLPLHVYVIGLQHVHALTFYILDRNYLILPET